MLLGFTASNCIVFAEYTLFACGRDRSDGEVKVVAAALLTVIIVIHSCFLKAGMFVQNVLGWVKIALVIFMICTSFFVVMFRHQTSDATAAGSATINYMDATSRSAWNIIWEGSVWNWGIISTALFQVFYSYAGLHNVNNVLNEVKDPVRTLKSAASTALWTACILYLLVNVAYFLVVPLDEIKNSGELIAALFFDRVLGNVGGKIILPLAVATSAAGNVMVVTFSHVSTPPRMSCASGGLTVSGSHDSRSRTAGTLPLLASSILLQSFSCAYGGSHCTFHPVIARYSHTHG